jgi:hypothetical protein
MTEDADESVQRFIAGAVSEAHPKTKKHGISCPCCIAAKRCNECLKPHDPWRRCTNARCEDCCRRVCAHVTS